MFNRFSRMPIFKTNFTHKMTWTSFDSNRSRWKQIWSALWTRVFLKKLLWIEKLPTKHENLKFRRRIVSFQRFWTLYHFNQLCESQKQRLHVHYTNFAHSCTSKKFKTRKRNKIQKDTERYRDNVQTYILWS